MKHSIKFVAAALALATPLAMALPQEAVEAKANETKAELTDEEVIAQQRPAYPIGHCIVSDEEMGGEHGEIIEVVHRSDSGARLFRLCCKGCKKALAKTPDEFVAALDARIVAEQSPSYPLDVCPVGGEPLGEGAVDVVVGTRLVKLCCNDCKQGLAKDPAAVIAKLDAALIEKQAAAYPLDTCLVSGEKLGGMGEPVTFVYGYRVAKVCCKACIKGVAKKHDETIAKLAGAKAEAH